MGIESIRLPRDSVLYVISDGGPGYAGLLHRAHDPKVVGKMAAHVVLRLTHRTFANLTR